MPAIDLIIYAFLGFLAIGGVWLAWSVHQGRVLCRELAKRFPSVYEEMGKPYPGFFYGLRRNAYMQFVMQRKFAELDDPRLVAEFESLRISEMRQLIFVIAGISTLGAAAIWYNYFRDA